MSRHRHKKTAGAIGSGGATMVSNASTTSPPQAAVNAAWAALVNAPHVPHGQIRLTSVDPYLVFQAVLGDVTPLISNGFGGWKTIDRPRRVQMTAWQGRQTFQLVCNVILNCFEEPTGKVDVEQEISVLESLAQVPDGKNEPPILQVDGGGAVPHDVHSAPKAFWVLNDIQYTEQLWNDNGRRSRAVATLTLLEYEPDVIAQTGKKASGAKKKVYIVKAGDTLQSIAAHQLHDRKRWRDIARLNHIRDPKAVHKGQHLKMP